MWWSVRFLVCVCVVAVCVRRYGLVFGLCVWWPCVVVSMVLVFGFWFLVFGFWFLVFGFWAVCVVAVCVVGSMVFGFWFLAVCVVAVCGGWYGFGFWFLVFGLCVSVCGGQHGLVFGLCV